MFSRLYPRNNFNLPAVPAFRDPSQVAIKIPRQKMEVVGNLPLSSGQNMFIQVLLDSQLAVQATRIKRCWNSVMWLRP